MIDWQAIAAEVSDALAEVGVAAVLRLAAVPGPVVPWDATAPTTPVEIAVTVMLDEVAKERDDRQAIMEEGKVIIATRGLAAAPGPADSLVIGGAVYRITKATPLNPGGVAVLYEVEVQR